ncbi:nuclear transport factor 2 family protein [Aequorivita marisscotiae]|uniref:Nuclear transport factor 2 family protein n=1 Tax=Aequorivita marisscotiae TaxID=3040348 RepID=A0ABY8KU75_9FLAO|nr:nuclear transport factor 2 family protein [Aequorivita sp. Ant34-E75]WGF92984.1 nuclear transport factor 2 family protein [Aequorivita sp. Ant34-E75]
MKKSILLVLAAVLSLTACKQQEKRYTQQSPEIDTYKKVIEAYDKQDWETMASHYSDTAKIMNNVTEKEAQTLAELVASDKEDASLFSSWEYVDGESEFEMVVTDKGKTYVNFWGLWQGTLAANNKTYTIPTHLTAQFVDGKIVKEFGYWDLSKIMLDMQVMQQAEAAIVKDSIN